MKKKSKWKELAEQWHRMFYNKVAERDKLEAEIVVLKDRIKQLERATNT